MVVSSFIAPDGSRVKVGDKVTVIGHPEDWSATVDRIERRGKHITIHLNTGQSFSHLLIRLVKE